MSEQEQTRPRVALACQGGGSHTAFTAGVLDRLLAEETVDFDIVGISGTSGGAICAFATWFGLASEGRDEGRETARELLAGIWDDLKAEGLVDAMANAVGVGMARAQGMGVPMPLFSPYDTPASDWGRDVLEATLKDAIGPDELAGVVGRDDPLPPRLDLGAVDVQRGTFRTFTERDVSYDAVLASASVPNLFQAAPVTQPDGTTRFYWDGLFSQNPPLGNLFGRAQDRLERPDELWIVQINPQRDDDIPTDLEGIADRRNELGGNLSVNQELETIRALNEWEAQGALDGVYEPVEVKTINLEESLLSPEGRLDYATKLDRAPRFLDRLWDHGTAQAERFLATERDRRRVGRSVRATWARKPEVDIDEWVVPTFEAHYPTGLAQLRAYLQDEPLEAAGRLDVDAAVEFSARLRDAFPDLEFAVEEVIAQQDAVATRWTATGTHTGTLLDIEPTGEDVTLSGMRIDHLQEGRLAETWLLTEQWSLLRQLEVTETETETETEIETETPVSTMSRVTATPVVTQLSAPAENEELARTLVEEVWSEGNRDPLARVLDESCVLYLDDEDDRIGRDAYWAFVSRYREAFPDLTLTIEDVVSEGDKIALRQRWHGTHESSVLGVDGTGTEVDVDRMEIHHIDDGRIVETGIVEDTVGLLQQLGAEASTGRGQG
jgi:NTE family protein